MSEKDELFHEDEQSEATPWKPPEPAVLVWTRRIWRFFGSYALAIAILLLLLALTYAGTMAQKFSSIHDVQEKYFNSYFVAIDLPLGIPFVVPGANLLLTLLFVNLMVGGIIRMRRDKSRIGIFTLHAGIAVMLLGNVVEYGFSTKGYMSLLEGEASDTYVSYTEWEVAVLESAPGAREETAHVISGDRFQDLGPSESASFTSPDLPFTVVLSGFLPNCIPVVAADGAALKAEPLDSEEAARNRAGLSVSVIGKGTRFRRDSVLWGRPGSPPWVFTSDGRQWGVVLRKRRYQLPYRVELRDVEADHHPGTRMAAKYASDVTRYEGRIAHDVHISMNEPMREGGYIFYQSGYQEASRMTGGKELSTFSVSHNPSDRVPWVAVTIIAVGLLIHFGIKLRKYIRAEAARRERLAHDAT
jgi:hypothetical protein